MSLRLGERHTSHIQNASTLFFGGGSSCLFFWRASYITSPKKKGKKDARHGIEFGHITDKVHLVWSDWACPHEEPGENIEDREEHDREVVSHKRGCGPVALEKNWPGAELEESRDVSRGTEKR